MVGEEELEDAVLGLLHLVRVGGDAHALGDLEIARGLQRRSARAVHLDEAHTAYADGLHARVVAKTWDVRTRALGGLDQEFAGPRLDRATVNGDVDVGAGDVSHGDNLRG